MAAHAIYGGQTLNQQEWNEGSPWYVEIVVTKYVDPNSDASKKFIITNSTATCGGVHVGKGKVVTAAHCITGFELAKTFVRTSDGKRNYPSAAYVHPFFRLDNATKLDMNNDIAVLTVQGLENSPAIPLLPLEKAASAYKFKKSMAILGSGRTQNDKPDEKLRMAILDVVRDTKCSNRYPEHAGYPKFTWNMLCAISSEKLAVQGIRKGDSGGPLLFEDSAGLHLAGLASWGSQNSRLSRKDPSVFLRTTPFVDWINELPATLPVRAITSEKPIGSVAITPDGKYAYVTHPKEGTMSIVPTSGGGPFSTLKIGGRPNLVVIDPHSNRAYVADMQSKKLTVIDSNFSSSDLSEKIELEDNPWSISLSADGSRIHISYMLKSAVSTFDTATGKHINTTHLDNIATNIVSTSDGSKIYVLDDSRSAIEIDTVNGETSKILFNDLAGNGTFTADGQRAYVTQGSYQIARVDVDRAESRSYKVGARPGKIVLAPNGKRAYVLNEGSNSISVFSIGDDEIQDGVIATIKVGCKPMKIAITPDGNTLYVTEPNTRDIWVVDASSF
ncbi:MAG: trypsin-like serine protease [Longispora sp.]|nr:trypsin-like serine protease [Longispora sp. (in: high G+C Gram-positive bacteria)]